MVLLEDARSRAEEFDFEGAGDFLAKIDVKKAEATVRADQERILRELEQRGQGGAEGVNNTVRKLLLDELKRLLADIYVAKITRGALR
mmetsp:Transcript_38947/g.87391  ORF Transcript_38947/g.87391 Transcript_38947/m.87391 type:complete len:88 (+) Transcript_38947:987-1250(+)